MMEWPPELIDSIARRKSVLYIGSGISANAISENGKRPATWEEFLRGVVKHQKRAIGDSKVEIEALLDQRKYLYACELIVDLIGEHAFGEEVQDEFRRSKYSSADIHKTIYGLDSKLVITPNIDKIYDGCALHESDNSVVVKNYYDADLAKYLRTNDYVIIKAHGTSDETSKMIFTHQQYSKARCQYASFYKLLDALVLTHTFIFLGCGIDDPDIELTLENTNFFYEGCPTHFFVTPSNAISNNMQKVLKKNRNVTVVPYENSSGDHLELAEGLKELKESVEAKRAELAGSLTW